MAFVAVLVITQIASAAPKEIVSYSNVLIDGVPAAEVTSLEAGQRIDLTVSFKPLQDVSLATLDANLRVDGKETSYTSSRFDLFANQTKTLRFSMTVPKNIDTSKLITLTIEVASDDGNGISRVYYNLGLHRQPFNIDVLNVEVPQRNLAGNVIPVNIVLKNRGYHELEDMFVVARIASLGIEKKVYASDLTPTDDSTADKEDAVEKTIFIQLPRDTKTGVYSLEVEASNIETSYKVVKSLVVSGEEGSSDVLTPAVSKTAAPGEEAVYDIVLVNSGSRMQLYTFSVEAPTGIAVSVDEPLVSVPADSTRVVKVRAKASAKGVYAFSVAVNSDGTLVKRVSLTESVEGSNTSVASPTIVLSIVLGIIFVVLVIVLIILLTRKPSRTEELGESYY